MVLYFGLDHHLTQCKIKTICILFSCAKFQAHNPLESFPSLQIKTLKLWCSTCTTLSPITNNSSIPKKRNLILWCHEIAAMGTQKSPTLRIVPLLSCNSIIDGLNKDDKEEVSSMLSSNYCPTSNYITSFQPNLNFWVKVGIHYMNS
jgi:hypothetical protein